jgi:hypothetical protein
MMTIDELLDLAKKADTDAARREILSQYLTELISHLEQITGKKATIDYKEADIKH